MSVMDRPDAARRLVANTIATGAALVPALPAVAGEVVAPHPASSERA
jgi:hypothetical protein